MIARISPFSLLLVLGLCFVRDARAATYAALSDAELVRRSPLIVHAEFIEERVRLEKIDGKDVPFTLVMLKGIEVLKGSLSDETFALRLPGGRAGEVGLWVPGTPEFLPEQQAVLFLFPISGRPGEYGLTEFALSKFDVLEDFEKHRFAVRSIFQSGEERLLSPDGSGEAAPDEIRDLEGFLSALRVAGRGAPLPKVPRGQPKGALRSSTKGLKPLWVNIGGREPGDCGGGTVPCQVRWFWDTGQSPNGVVTVSGSQTNLSDGSNGVAHVASAVSAWTGIPSTNVVYSSGAGGNVAVNLDVENQSGGAWMGSIDCGAGVLGFAGPFFSLTPRTFKGEVFYAAQRAFLDVRKNVCTSGYSVAVFRSVVVHEKGHTLCLGHPDLAQSVHSTTGPADWNNAVMRSVVPNVNPPNMPQTDDIQAMQYYYGTQQPPGPGVCVPDANTLCLSGGRFQVRAVWRRPDGTSGNGMTVGLTGDTGYMWFFDPANVEMVVKVLNACSFASRIWVFAGGLTNVMVTTTVTDTQTGAVKPYINPQGTAFAPIQDTSAFATCP